MSRSLRYLSWAVRLLLFLLLFAFAVKNTAPAVVHFYLGSQWEAPMALVAFVFFALGAVAGVAGCFSYLYRQRREILKLRKDLRARPGATEDAI